MTRVLLINKLFYPVFGGVETAVAQVAQGLASDENFEATILAGNDKRAFVNKVYKWNNVSVHKTASAGLIYNTALSIQYPFALRALIQQHDVLHFQVPNPLGELSFYFNKIPSHKKVVVTVHADIAQTRRKLYSPVYNFFLKKLLDRADVITTMSPQNLTGFPILQAYLPKCTIVPLAYDGRHIQDVTDAEKALFKKKFNLDNSRQTVLFVGRLTEDKGLQYLLEAAGKMPDVQFVIAGDGRLKNYLVELAEQSLNKHIYFTGYIQSKDMACAYSMADVFVLPSTSETFGLVQAEAMRFGVPVINTALNTGSNFVSLHNQTGLTVPPGDANALATAIEIILNDAGLRNSFSKNALERSALFSPEQMVAAFKEIYKGEHLKSLKTG